MPALSSLVIGGSALLGAGSSIISGNKAAKAQKQAAQQSADVQRYMFDTTNEQQAPYREVGQGALYKLADMYGVSRPVPSSGTAAPPAGQTGWFPTGWESVGGRAGEFTTGGGAGVTQAPQQEMTEGYDGFEASPGYQFRLGEGIKAVERSAAARGLLGSGGTMKGIQRYGEGLASSEYENYANALRSMAGIGQTATQATSSAGQSAAQGISNAFTNAGNARATSYANTGAAINNATSNVLGAYLQGGFGSGGGSSLPSLSAANYAQLNAGIGGIGSGGSVSNMMPSWYGGS